MQVCTLLQTDNHASTPPLVFYRPVALPATQPTASKHWRQQICNTKRHILKVTQPGAVDTVVYTQTDLPEGSTTVQPCGAVLYLRFLSLGLVDTYACLVLVSGIGSMLPVWELHCVTHWAMAHSSTQDVWNLIVLQNANLAGLGFCGTAELCVVSIPHGA